MGGAEAHVHLLCVCCQTVAVTSKAGFLGRRGVPSSHAREQQDGRSNPIPLFITDQGPPGVRRSPHPRRSPLGLLPSKPVVVQSSSALVGLSEACLGQDPGLRSGALCARCRGRDI